MMRVLGFGWHDGATDVVLVASAIAAAVTIVITVKKATQAAIRWCKETFEHWLYRDLSGKIATSVGDAFVEYTKKQDDRWNLNTTQHQAVVARLDTMEKVQERVQEEVFRTGARLDAHIEMHKEHT